jgi:hypothetical protein
MRNLGLLLLGLLLCHAREVQAGILWSATMTAQATGGSDVLSALSVPPGSAGVKFLPGSLHFGSGNGGLSVSFLPFYDPAQFPHGGNFSVGGSSASNYSVTVNLTDLASGVHRTFTFPSALFGLFSNTTASFFSLNSGPQSWQLGHNIYTVSIPFIEQPGPLGSSQPGRFDAEVQVKPAATPEPATLTLAGLGLVGLLGAARRERRPVPASPG